MIPEGGYVLELAILGLLKEQQLHGYEIKKRLGETLGILVSVSFGSLYPALARLEAAGAVVAVPDAGTGPAPDGGAPPGPGGAGSEPGTRRIPMTGSLGGERAAFLSRPGRAHPAGPPPGRAHPAGPPPGRAHEHRLPRAARQRKVYAVTPAGLVLFDQLMGGAGMAAEDDRGFALRLAFARYLSPEARLRLLERRRAVLTQRGGQEGLAGGSAEGRGDTWRVALAERRAETLASDIVWLDRLIDAERAALAVSRISSPLGPAEAQTRKETTA